MEDYLNLTYGARARLAVLRTSAASGKFWIRPMTWRDCRFANFKTASTMSAGFNGEDHSRVPIWYALEPQFRREQFANEIRNAQIKHTKWFCDSEQRESARGIVVALPHGKFIAGYWLSDNDERVYFPEIFNDETDAARMADEHARVIAESEYRHSERWNEAQRLESDIEELQSRLCECFALRNKPKFANLREELRNLVQSIRDKRETLARDFAGVL